MYGWSSANSLSPAMLHFEAESTQGQGTHLFFSLHAILSSPSQWSLWSDNIIKCAQI